MSLDSQFERVCFRGLTTRQKEKSKMEEHKSFFVGTLILSSVLLLNPEAKGDQSPTLRLQIPPEVNTPNLTIISGVYGHGLGVSSIDTKPGVFNYSIPLGKKAKSVKLLIYAPGYKVVTAQFEVKTLSAAKPFVPRFAKLPTTLLKLKLAGSNGKPVINEKITLSHDLATHQYFGYLDGMAFGASLINATSDNEGEINIQMPLLSQDPYFVKHSLTQLTISNGSGQFFSRSSQDFSPARLPVQNSYEQPITVKKIYRAKLSGKIYDSFFRRHKVEGDITPYLDAKRHSPFRVEMRAETVEGRATYNCMLLPNRNFSVVLPTGAYNLHLVVLGEGERLHKKIAVHKNVMLKENENRKLVIK